jgi:hypothetical protein
MFGAFADPVEVHVAPGTSTSVTLHAYATGVMPPLPLEALPGSPELTATLDKSKVSNGDQVNLSLTASASYVEYPGSNIVRVYAIGRRTTAHACRSSCMPTNLGEARAGRASATACLVRKTSRTALEGSSVLHPAGPEVRRVAQGRHQDRCVLISATARTRGR